MVELLVQLSEVFDRLAIVVGCLRLKSMPKVAHVSLTLMAVEINYFLLFQQNRRL
jgi:hypothetical protein